MSRIVVTGANGFVGRALCRVLLAAGHEVTGLVRRRGGCIDGVSEWVHEADDFVGVADRWPSSLQADVVVHLAARVHVMRDRVLDPDTAFRTSNVAATLRVARAARQQGARRFVFLSSIKAIAEADGGAPLREDSIPAPQDAYGRSKLEAERALEQLRDGASFDTVIIRPPLVYGPEVRANFLSLMRAVAQGVPLPLGAVRARRSMVYVDNLADAVMHCAIEPAAMQGCFHVADDGAPTIAELVNDIARHLGRSARLLPIPEPLLRVVGAMTGRTAQIDRLTNDLRLDTAHIRAVLGWRPPYSREEGLAETTRWFQSLDRCQSLEDTRCSS
ncbi:UDP-glucose 4-epimerase family protein [Burkholderia thailandensis]|nr:SDR family oxidoreductase [Burkholderia thailandensis]AEO78441.1 NAD-dependent epimerase/dehydratase [Burkholderia thailandensis]AEO78457.1 NAD-dependent epimerase/dehydratase [Burkholderia thailandensis]AHI72837.1 3-beta hydroxysteroid dehydrogenase/isomerase family protein [Burkholderia thailandensis 2002721723]AIC86537.1 3-beta hydroxysteroid dehydrogenase/isomerase family protein [Burkholderia thailandensis USAMRU Malaysia \